MANEIIFLVGPNKCSITADMSVLSSKSPVFESMFSGIFTIDKEILIHDIEKELFMQLPAFINDQPVTIELSNVLGLLYGAEKYMLEPLKKKCESFLLENLSSNNKIPNIFQMLEDATLAYNYQHILEKVKNILLDDPLFYFNTSEFLDISEPTFKMIMQQPKINCTTKSLLKVALKWLKHNGYQSVDTISDAHRVLESNLGVSISKSNSYFSLQRLEPWQYIFEKLKTVSEGFRLPDSSYLHGLELLVGVFPMADTVLPADYCETVTITICGAEERKVLKKFVKKIHHPILSKIGIITIIFEKLQAKKYIRLDDSDDEVEDNNIIVDVDFGVEHSRPVIQKHHTMFGYRPDTPSFRKDFDDYMIKESVIGSLLYTDKK